MLGIRNVIFDLGGVVLDWNPDRIVSRFQPDSELQARFKADLFDHPDWQLFDRGTLTEAELIGRMQIRTGRPKVELSSIIDAVRDSLIEKSETVDLVRTLHQRGTPLYCLSNMPASIYTHLRQRHAFWDVFRGIVISGEVQLVKPEPQVFLHLLDKFNIRAEETVFVDDVPQNIEGAKRIGLHTILFRDASQCRRELEQLFAIQGL